MALHPWRPGRGVGASHSEAGPRKPIFPHPSEAGLRHWSAPSGGWAEASQHPPWRPGRCITASPLEAGPRKSSFLSGCGAEALEHSLWRTGRDFEEAGPRKPSFYPLPGKAGPRPWSSQPLGGGAYSLEHLPWAGPRSQSSDWRRDKRPVIAPPPYLLAFRNLAAFPHFAGSSRNISGGVFKSWFESPAPSPPESLGLLRLRLRVGGRQGCGAGS